MRHIYINKNIDKTKLNPDKALDACQRPIKLVNSTLHLRQIILKHLNIYTSQVQNTEIWPSFTITMLNKFEWIVRAYDYLNET